jgi:uncharacterized heparinase superfamily protein
VCDVAKPPPRTFSERAHAGTLAFEMTVRACRMVVNCGRPEARNRRANEAARSTAAHSTLVVGDVSSSRFAAHGLYRWLGDQIVSGPERVEAARADAALGMSVTASHDGYLERFGVVHQRRLLLANDGARLDGEDRLIVKADRTKADQSYVIRFHLHPSVRAEPGTADGGVLLTLPDDDRWRFVAEGFSPRLEESIFFAAAEGPRRTMQIVVEARLPATMLTKWCFERLSTPAS